MHGTFSAVFRCTSLCFLIVAAGACTGVERNVVANEPGSSSQLAERVLNDWYAALNAAQTVSVETSATFTLAQAGNPLGVRREAHSLVLRRPQRISIMSNDPAGLSVINGEAQLTESSGELKRYVLHKAPIAAIGELIAKSPIVARINLGQGLSLVGDALVADSRDSFAASLENLAYVDRERLGNTSVSHLRFERDKVQFDAWFTTDSPPRLIKVAPDVRAIAEKNGRAIPDDVQLEMAVEFTRWNYDGPVSDAAFSASVPADFELVDDLFAPPRHPLVGKQAPAFELTTLTGGRYKSAAQAGKVVVLDFWATWCGPCVAALPKISATASRYKDKGVVFFAVNQGEDPVAIHGFLKSQKLDVPVLLDQDGSVGARYGVEGIPQTVIIDQHGKVQVVHVGAGDAIGDQLAKELDGILAGKDQADSKLKTQAK